MGQPDRASQLLELIEHLQTQVEDLREQLSLLAVQHTLGATPIDRTDSDGNHDLAAWVTWLIDSYGLHDTIPACWAQHPAIGEELAALHAAHDGAHHDLNARPADRLAWHDALPRALARIRDWDRTRCRSRGHQD